MAVEYAEMDWEDDRLKKDTKLMWMKSHVTMHPTSYSLPEKPI